MDDLQDRIEVDSMLSELGRVWPWAEALADKHHLPDQTRYAIQLCMEEALANVVIHGYGNEPGHPIVIRSTVGGGWVYFAIEDKAPPFAPAEERIAPNEENPPSIDSIQVGGNGIRLLRKFASFLQYEALPNGNRLVLGFPLTQRESSIPAQPQSA